MVPKCGKFKRGAIPRRNGSGRVGFTLIEVIVAFALLTMAMASMMYVAMAAVRMNKLTEVEIAATNAINGQVEAIMAAARDNASAGQGAAKGFAYFLREMRKIVDSKDPDHPVRAHSDMGDGVFIYEFPLAVPGFNLTGPNERSDGVGVNDGKTGLSGYANLAAKGVMQVYFDEGSVPSSFREWVNIQQGKSPTTEVQDWFDMDGDGENGGHFGPLFEHSSSDDIYGSSKLANLPISITVLYYETVEDMRKDTPVGSNIGFIKGPKAGVEDEVSLVYSAQRFFILNDSTIM